MRTNMKVKKVMRKFFMMTAVAALFVGCGKDNTSGKSSSGSYGTYNTYDYTGYSSSNGVSLPANWLDVVINENPCQTGSQQRQRIRINANNANLNSGGLYVGVTLEGDVGILSKQGNNTMLEVIACTPYNDKFQTNSGQVLTDNYSANNWQYTAVFSVNTSPYCPIAEMTAVDVMLNSQQTSYRLKFAPIQIPNAGRYSSLCRN